MYFNKIHIILFFRQKIKQSWILITFTLVPIGVHVVYPHKDKDGRTVLWVRFGRYHKSRLTELIKQYAVYQIEKCDSQTSYEGWAMISDNSTTGLSNVDMDFNNFLTDVLQTHYPRGPKYSAVVDLPFIMNATSKLIMAFMNEELKNIIKYITKDELTQYLESCHIPVHLKGSYDKEIEYMPSGAKPLEQIGGFTAEQIKKIRSTFKEELKA